MEAEVANRLAQGHGSKGTLGGLEEFLQGLARGGASAMADMLDIVASGVLVVSADLEILFVNSKACSLLDTLREELAGSPVSVIFMPDDQEFLARNVFKLVKEKGSYETDLMLRRGRLSNFLALFSGYWWAEKGLYIVSINDITRVKGFEQILSRSERMLHLGRMLDDISHQIRNPVLAIGGFARRLARTKVEKPEYLDVIIEEASRLETLLDVLSHYIQLPRPKFAPVSTSDLAEALDRWIAGALGGRDVEVSLDVAGDRGQKCIVTDLHLLEQAVVPVLLNGVESYDTVGTAPRLRLMLTARSGEAAGKGCELVVEDFGEGIRSTLMNRVFHPFFTTKTGHIGMGLTFTKRIMEDLDGSVSIRSTLGRGTVVSISLPGDRRRPIRTRLL